MTILRNRENRLVKYKGVVYYLHEKTIKKWFSNKYIDSKEKFEEIIHSDFEKFEFSDIPDVPRTYEEYLTLSKKNMEAALADFKKNRIYYLTLEEKLDSFIIMEHELQPSEIDAVYDAHLSIVINGREFHDFLDEYDNNGCTMTAFYGCIFYCDRYMSPEELDAIIPEQYRFDIPSIREDFYENGFFNRRHSNYLFDKNYRCIDKLILYRKYIDPSSAFECKSDTRYTGKVETVEMNYYNLEGDLPPEMFWFIRKDLRLVSEATKIRRMKYLRALSRLSKENYAYGRSVDKHYGEPIFPKYPGGAFRGEYSKTEKYHLSILPEDFKFSKELFVDYFEDNEPIDIGNGECLVYDDEVQDYVVRPYFKPKK